MAIGLTSVFLVYQADPAIQIFKSLPFDDAMIGWKISPSLR